MEEASSAGYGRELHVLLSHDAVHHVSYETGYRLVEMGNLQRVEVVGGTGKIWYIIRFHVT